MRKSVIAVVISSFVISFAIGVSFADDPPKPRTRADAESKEQNLKRYEIGDFSTEAKSTLGLEIKFPVTNNSSGVTVQGFATDSKAEDAGIERYDWILEIDDSPVGLIRGRYYQLWPQYGRSGAEKVELLVSYVDSSDVRRYYYKKVPIQAIQWEKTQAEYTTDFFTATRPRERSEAEGQDMNFARYVLDTSNFTKYGRLELGADVRYTYEDGAVITNIKSGSAAESYGLKVGDLILECAGAPVGVFGNRTYEVWRQYDHAKENKAEFLICFLDPTTNRYRYYYPEIELKELTVQN